MAIAPVRIPQMGGGVLRHGPHGQVVGVTGWGAGWVSDQCESRFEFAWSTSADSPRPRDDASRQWLTRRPGSEPETVVGMVSDFAIARRWFSSRCSKTRAPCPEIDDDEKDEHHGDDPFPQAQPVDVQADVTDRTLSAMEPYPLVSKVDLSRSGHHTSDRDVQATARGRR